MVPAFTVFLVVISTTNCFASLQKRFEYKHSFKGPHLVQKDRTVPFWTYVGNAIASDDFVRLAPSLKSQRGLIWNKIPVDFDNWEVEITFKIAGRGRIGADGMAFWYTQEKEALTGPVFGARDQWKGLGVFFDSFDNDNQNNNPYISAQINDGTKKFDHHTDGSAQQLGGCMRDYRNKPYPVRAKIRYENKVLSLFTSSGLTKNAAQDEDETHLFDMCAYIPNVELEKGGHFSVSAATGGLADDHDVLSFLASSLRPESEMKAKQVVAEEEKQKYEKEFEEYDKKLEEAKEEFQKENPNVTQKPEETIELYDANVQELKMIFDGQSNIQMSINSINKRVSELIGMTQQITSQVALLQTQAQQAGAAPAHPTAGASSIQRHEVDTLIRASTELLNAVNTIRSSVDTLSKEKRAAEHHPFEKQQHQVADGINELKSSIQKLSSETQHQLKTFLSSKDCPEVNCVSLTYFGVLIGLQLAVFIIYVIYNAQKEAASKKFY